MNSRQVLTLITAPTREQFQEALVGTLNLPDSHIVQISHTIAVRGPILIEYSALILREELVPKEEES